MTAHPVTQSGFFNSINNDRIYQAEDFTRLFSFAFSDGIVQSKARNYDEFKPQKGKDNTHVIFNKGMFMYNGFWGYNAGITFDMTTADGWDPSTDHFYIVYIVFDTGIGLDDRKVWMDVVMSEGWDDKNSTLQNAGYGVFPLWIFPFDSNGLGTVSYPGVNGLPYTPSGYRIYNYSRRPENMRKKWYFSFAKDLPTYGTLELGDRVIPSSVRIRMEKNHCVWEAGDSEMVLIQQDINNRKNAWINEYNGTNGWTNINWAEGTYDPSTSLFSLWANFTWVREQVSSEGTVTCILNPQLAPSKINNSPTYYPGPHAVEYNNRINASDQTAIIGFWGENFNDSSTTKSSFYSISASPLANSWPILPNTVCTINMSWPIKLSGSQDDLTDRAPTWMSQPSATGNLVATARFD